MFIMLVRLWEVRENLEPCLFGWRHPAKGGKMMLFESFDSIQLYGDLKFGYTLAFG